MSIQKWTDFNSIKVRLEPNWLPGVNKVLEFQFHKGTIRTWLQSQERQIQADFNSIKVRLERSQDDEQVFYVQFQFHKGTIRTWQRY